MGSKNILITGGAGFIGSHLVDNLLEKGHNIRIYDNLEPQVHGNLKKTPDYLNKNIEFILGDIRSREKLKAALKDIEVIYHLASMVGVGQSMYQIDRYIDVNTRGTAMLLDILINESNNVKKLIIASSMSTYGEGCYECESCGKINPKIRSPDQITRGDWELKCPICLNKLKSKPTDENKPQDCTLVYAWSKYYQEKFCLLIGRTYGLDTTVLRLFNVYGIRQSLSNPYTGVCAIFSSNFLMGKSPIIYEDGNQTRDFVHVKDICQALQLSIEKPEAKNEIFNVGTGKPISINDVANTLGKLINPDIKTKIIEKYRTGDIRHCIADISKIKEKLGYVPKYSFESGMKELIDWVKSQMGKISNVDKDPNQELMKKGLI